MSLFLTDEEVAELTGIKRGSAGKTKAQLQCEYLRAAFVPFIPNVMGEPKISRDFINHVSKEKPKAATSWKPATLAAA